MLIIKVVNFIYIPVKITYNITRLAKRRIKKRRRMKRNKIYRIPS